MEERATPKRRSSLDERLASLADRQQQLEARRQGLLAVKKAAAHRRETRRRIIVGAAVLAAAEDLEFRDAVARILDAHVTKKTERAAVADLLPPSSQD